MALHYPWITVAANALLEILSAAILFPLKARKKSGPVRKMLLVEPFGMGDVLSLSVMLEPLKEAFPESEIRLLLKQGNEGIYSGDPRIAKIHSIPVPWSRLSGQKKGALSEWMKIWKTCREIAVWSPDVGLDSRSEIRSQILMVLAGCRRRIGFRNYLNTNLNVRGLLLTDVVEKPPVLNRYAMNLLLVEKGLQIPVRPLHFPSFISGAPAMRAGQSDRPQVLIHIGARWQYRQWPVSCWIELCRRLNAHPVSVVVAGSPDEATAVQEITSSASGTVPVCADMNQLIGLVKGSDLFVGLDSGPMHLAQTLGVPVVALFGPGDSELWRPQGEKDQTIFHRLPCNPCLQKNCVRPDDSCMPKITPYEVYAAVLKIFETQAEKSV